MKTILTWYGHATLSLNVGEHQLLVDPFFSGNPTAAVGVNEAHADYILITHGHGDHVGDAQTIAKRDNATIISNFEISNWFEAQGFATHAQHLGGGYHHPFGYLKLTLALHGEDGNGGKKGELARLKEKLKEKCWVQKQKHDAKLQGGFEGVRSSMERFRDKVLQEQASNAAVLLTLPEL